ncbi:DUF397 domain-containing protein [Saccharomonospora iraqiensis]|uniref:DUF397 domain-containing protein n=1 Tax=Saccharomonospora iraqiensis TaxID=52698 RepID=UPI000400EE06|nr:DUF397 domain-containing protein [Saccharomonospora iraqiensis]
MTGQQHQDGWRKSSYSGLKTDCVEFRRVDGGVEVRNSKRPEGATIRYTDAEWRAFLAGVKDGEFDL